MDNWFTAGVFTPASLKNQLKFKPIKMQTEYTFITRISQTDFEITYTADADELGLLSIKVLGSEMEFWPAGKFDKLIEKEVRTHHEINHKQVIHLN